MSKVTVIDNEYTTIWFHPETKIVHHEVKKFIYDAEFREVLNQGYELLKKNAAIKWLSDDRKNGPITHADEEWAKTDWFPRVVAAGWKYWAIVMPEKIMGQINMKRHSEDYAKAGVTAQFFSDPDEALKWLESV